MKARRVCGPMDGAAADRVEHQRRDIGLAVVHRIVLGQAADIRVVAEARSSAEFPICVAGRVLLWFLPSALLEAQNPNPASESRQATAAPEAPEPMIRMSTSAFAKFASSRVRRRSCGAPRRNHHAPIVRAHDEEATEVSEDLERVSAALTHA